MNRNFFNILVTITIIFTTSCTYKPIFSDKNYNFEIERISLVGEKDINRVIKNKLSMIKNSEDNQKEKFNVIIESKKNKKVISNDSKGDPLKFEISILVSYKIENNGELILKREIKKSNVYNNESDKFKLEQNEKIILTNLSEKVSDNIISSIINLNDN